MFTGAKPFWIHRIAGSRSERLWPLSMWNSRKCYYIVSSSCIFVVRPPTGLFRGWGRVWRHCHAPRYLSITEPAVHKQRETPGKERRPGLLLEPQGRGGEEGGCKGRCRKESLGWKSLGMIIYISSVYLQVTSSFAIRCKVALQSKKTLEMTQICFSLLMWYIKLVSLLYTLTCILFSYNIYTDDSIYSCFKKDMLLKGSIFFFSSCFRRPGSCNIDKQPQSGRGRHLLLG